MNVSRLQCEKEAIVRSCGSRGTLLGCRRDVGEEGFDDLMQRFGTRKVLPGDAWQLPGVAVNCSSRTRFVAVVHTLGGTEITKLDLGLTTFIIMRAKFLSTLAPRAGTYVDI